MARTTIPAELVAINAIQGTLIADNAITAVHIATNAVSGTLVADNAITSTHIAQNNVTATQIAQNTITVTQMADSAIETAKINNDAVTQAKIADDAVGPDQLAANAVVSASIANGTIIEADMADNAVTLAKMASLARGKIIVGDSAGDPSALAIGSNGTVLSSDGTDVSWAAASGGVDGIVSSADATAITIDSSERIGIPAIGQVNVLGTIIPYVSVNGQNADQAHINIHRHRAAALAGYLSFSKSRSATKDFTIVQDDDPFGTIDFQGADGNQFQQGAQIQSYVDGTPGAGTMPGRLVFKTTTSSGPVERMRIDSAGSVSIGDTDGDYESRNGSKGLHVKRGGILMNGPAGDANMSSATDANQWTYHAQGGRGGNFTSVYFSVPNPNGGASGQGYGGFSVEFYIAGYNAKYHSGHYSGYTNNGIVQSASAFYATSGSSSIAAVSVGSQGFKITVSFPSMTHPTAKFVVNKGGHGHNSRWTDMSGAQIGWA